MNRVHILFSLPLCFLLDICRFNSSASLVASLVAQMVKNLPAMRETWVRKIPWRRTWQPTPVFLPGESPWTEEPGGLHSWTWLSNWAHSTQFLCYVFFGAFYCCITCSVTQSCLTLCDPMDYSTPGFPVYHQHPELAQTHIYWVGDAIQPFHPLSSPSLPAFNLSQHQGLFQRVNTSHQVAKVLEFQLQHQSFQWIFRTDFL